MGGTNAKPVPTLAMKFPAVVVPNGDGSFTLKPGRPVKAEPLTVNEAATVLGCCGQQVINLIRAGRIKSHDVGAGKKRRHLRIEPEELARYKAGRVS